MSQFNLMDLCRLCLDKDRVSIPIFEGEGVVKKLYMKIGACLPVKVSETDRLPKKICDDCIYKVELVYSFWNTTANAEKQLLSLLGDADSEPQVPLSRDSIKTDNEVDVGNGMESSDISLRRDPANQGSSANPLTSPTNMPLGQQPPVHSAASNSTDNRLNESTNQSREEEEEESGEEESDDDGQYSEDEDDPAAVGEEESTYSTLEPTFVSVGLMGEAGPSGLQQDMEAENMEGEEMSVEPSAAQPDEPRNEEKEIQEGQQPSTWSPDCILDSPTHEKDKSGICDPLTFLMIDFSRRSGLPLNSPTKSAPNVSTDCIPTALVGHPRRGDKDFFKNLKTTFRKTVAACEKNGPTNSHCLEADRVLPLSSQVSYPAEISTNTSPSGPSHLVTSHIKSTSQIFSGSAPLKSQTKGAPNVPTDCTPSELKYRPRRKDADFFENLKTTFGKTVANCVKRKSHSRVSDHAKKVCRPSKSHFFKARQVRASSSRVSCPAETPTNITCQSQPSQLLTSHSELSPQVFLDTTPSGQTEPPPEDLKASFPHCYCPPETSSAQFQILGTDSFQAVGMKVEVPDDVCEAELAPKMSVDMLQSVIISTENPFVVLERIPSSVVDKYKAEQVHNANLVPTRLNPIVRLERI